MSIYEYDEERQRRFDREEGEERLAELLNILLKTNDHISMQKALTDKKYRNELYIKYSL